MDLGYKVILVLLDFTAAFDTIDHSILLTRLEQRFGISGKAWKWLASVSYTHLTLPTKLEV